MKKFDYKNETWEPYFDEIAPVLSKIYFSTNFGLLKRLVAALIFKKLTLMEMLRDGRKN